MDSTCGVCCSRRWGTAAAAERLKQTACTQPALFVIEYALAGLWRSWGVEPRAMIGHSVGEFVAACLAGVFEWRDALSLVATRGRLMQRMPAGAMLGVALPPDRVAAILGEDAWISVINGPDLCVVSAPADRIDALEQRLQRAGVGARRLETSHAFHSPMMDPIVDEFAAAVGRTPRSAPRIPFVSNVTGTWMTAGDAQDPGYWSRHLRNAVNFAEGIGVLLEDGKQILLEVGPGRTLAGLARQHPKSADTRTIVSSLPQQGTDGQGMAAALGRVWAAGIPIKWDEYYRSERRRRVALPTYPFERKRYWIELNRSAAPTAPAVERAALADWFNVPTWKRAVAAPKPAALAARAERWLVFADALGVADRALAQLREDGHLVTVVEPGSAFACVGRDRYTVDPGSSSDYRALLKALKESGIAPEVIGHFWTVSAADGLDQPSDTYVQRGFYSLLFLAQAIGESLPDAAVRIGVVTTGLQAVFGDEALTPSKAALLGPARVIPQEYPQVACRTIDIVASEWATSDARRTRALVSEIRSAETAPLVAHRRMERWVPTLEPMQLGAVEASPRLRERGVYLITGGGGGIGLTLGAHLARSVKANLILTSRTKMPVRGEWAAYLDTHAGDDRVSRQIRAVEALERDGATVMVAAADVANLADMQTVVANARRRFGRIDGVIHAAGVAGGGIIQLKNRDEAARVLAPKVTGTEVLFRALGEAPLDFVVLCSSMTSLVGGAGQVDYCGANACLDAFAHAYSRQTGTFTVAMNWDAWQEVGMAVETNIPEHLARQRAELLKRAILPAEGAEAFHRILTVETLPQVLVSPLPWSSRTAAHEAAKPDTAASAAPESEAADVEHGRPSLSTDYVAPSDDIERAIVDIWQRMLGLSPVGTADDFFELGGHSLLALRITTRLRDDYGLDLSLRDFFEAPSVGKLAELVRRNQPVADREEIEIV